MQAFGQDLLDLFHKKISRKISELSYFHRYAQKPPFFLLIPQLPERIKVKLTLLFHLFSPVRTINGLNFLNQSPFSEKPTEGRSLGKLLGAKVLAKREDFFKLFIIQLRDPMLALWRPSFPQVPFTFNQSINFFFKRVRGNEAVNGDVLLLSDAISSVCRLIFNSRIPP